MKSKILKLTQIAFLIVLAFASCKPEKKETINTEDYKGIYVVNEGGFLKSNGSTGLYKPGSGDYFDAFLKANGRPLGDIVQTMLQINDKYYIIVNNSNKIEVVNQSDFSSVATIPVIQPKNILMVSDTKAYISQLNSNVMSVLDLTSNTITKTIDLKCATDNMVLMDKSVYVGKAYSDRIYEIMVSSDQVVDSVIVGSGISSLVNINSTQIGVFCLGVLDFNTGSILEKGKIVVVGDSNKIQSEIVINSAGYGGSMVYNSSYLYYTFGDGKLFRVASGATIAAATPFIEISGSIYGITIDPSSNDIYLMDPKDYSGPGKVLVYNKNGAKIKEFTAGIVPNKVVFNY